MTERYSPSQLNDDDEDSDEIEMNQQPSIVIDQSFPDTAAEDEQLDQVLDEEQHEEGEQELVEGPQLKPENDEQVAACSDDDVNNKDVEISVPAHMTTAEKCELCDVEHSSEESADEHYGTSEHADKVNDYVKSLYSDSATDAQQNNGDAPDDDNSEIPSVQVEITDEFIQKYKFSCTYCGLCFQEFEHMFRHEKGPMHAIRVWEYQQNVGGYNTGSRPKRNKNPEWPEGFYCSICDVDLTSAELYQEHLKSEQHETKAQRLLETGTPAGNGDAEGNGDGSPRGMYRGGWRGGMMRGGGGPWRGPVPLNMMHMGGGGGYGPGPGGPWMRGRGGPRFRPYDFGPRGGFRGGPRGYGGGPGGPGGPRGPYPMGPMRGGRGGGPPGQFNFFNSGGSPGGGFFPRAGGAGDQTQTAPKHGYTMGTGGYTAQQAQTPGAANPYGAQSGAQPTDDQSQQTSTGPKPWWNI